jgi:hypothetical protein
MPRTASLTRQAIWRSRVSRQALSGLSIAQFCARESCSISAFYRWKSRFELVQRPDPCPTLPTPSTFLPVTVRLVEANDRQLAPIEADLPNGIRLRIPTTSPRLACRIIRSIAAAKANPGGSQ